MSKHSVRQLTPARLVLGSAAAVLVVLVVWVAIRAGGPANAGADPVIVQPSGPAAADLQAVESTLSPSPPAASSAAPSVSVSVSVAATSTSPSASASPSRKPRKSKSPKPSTTSTSPSPTRSSAPPPPPPPADDLKATYTTTASWRGGLIGNVRIVNTGSVASDFTVTITFRSGADLRLRSAWNSAGEGGGDRITLRGAALAPGATINAGFQADKGRDSSSRATGCTISGGSCNVS